MKPDLLLQEKQNYQGLSDEEAALRLAREGFNELQASKPRNFLRVSLEVLKEPMFILLLFCCFLYVVLGDLQEALILSVFVPVVIGITLFQSWKTERALDALKDLSSPKTLVVRNGRELYISSRDLVVGDIVILNEGDRISADVIILHSVNLAVDEAPLTGESVPVHKDVIPSELRGFTRSLYERSALSSFIAYSGTLVTQGRAYAQVIATASRTELGKIGKSMESITKGDSRFKTEISQIVTKILSVAVISCLLIIIIMAGRNSLVQGLLTSITFAIAMLPEEVPAVLTIFMALGAWRIAQAKVLTRKMSAIETLGSITVLCSDKTGTITENKMRLSEVYTDSKTYKLNDESIPEEYHSLIEFSILASREKSFDPMEKALVELLSSQYIDEAHVHKDWILVQEYPLSKDLLAMSRAWEVPGGQEFSFYTKGSPEAVFDLCHLNESEIKALTAIVEDFASRSLRVLGVAKSRSSELPSNQHDIDFEFCGLLGFFDPIRPGVKEAVRDCYSAGIKVLMITGDHHLTAQNIAKEIGLQGYDNYLTGLELAQLSDKELAERITNIVICSRVSPEQKLRIVNALKNNQEIIAMTGDGVNDAPALKASHVGIAMGTKGTDVARESADLILLDDNFSSIVSAIKLGRRVYENLRKAISYILAVHVPIAGLTLVPVFFAGLPVIFHPIHVAFLELITDPTCSVVFESEPASRDLMTRTPRKINETLLSNRRFIISIFQGLLVFLLTLIVYLWTIQAGKPEGEVRSLSFVVLLIGNLFLTLANKSWRGKAFVELVLENKSFIVVISVLAVSLFLIFYVPVLKNLFYFT
jgi:Ca2+-transporting ATPase